jgi:hypothetical protein
MMVIANCKKTFKVKYTFTNVDKRSKSKNMGQDITVLFKVWAYV